MEDTELEIKFRFINETDTDLLPENLKEVFSLNHISFKSRELENIYYDTKELSLNKAYLTFRTRKSGERCNASVKLSDMDSESMLFKRKEWEVGCDDLEPVPELFIDTGVWQRLKKALKGRKLVGLFKTEFTRSLYIISPSPQAEIEISVDKGKIVSEEKELPILEMELEIKKGDILDLISAAKRLSHSMALLPEPLSKYERGAALQGIRTHNERIRKKLIPTTGNIQGIFSHAMHHLVRCQNDFIAYPYDPKMLHRFRAAIASMRALTSFYRKNICLSFRKLVKSRLGPLSKMMSKARELYILKQYCLDSEICSRDITEHIEEEINNEIEGVYSYILSGETTIIILDLLQGLASGAVEKDYKDFRKDTTRLFDKKYKKLKKTALKTHLGDPLEAHRLRIGYRELKNTIECIENSYHSVRKKKKIKLSRIQDEIGKLHDIWRNIELTKELFSKYDLDLSKELNRHLEKLLEKQRKKAIRVFAGFGIDVADGREGR